MKILVYGAGGHAKVALDVICKQEIGRVVGLIDDHPGKKEAEYYGIPVLGDASILGTARVPHAGYGFVAIGDNRIRLEKAALLESHGLILIRAIHPKAIVSDDATIEPGAVVMAGAILNPGVTVGRNAIVNTGAVLDHDCVIGEGAHVSPGAVLAGGVRVGRLAHIGAGATAIPGVKIGESAVLGAGSVALRDIPDGVTAVGNPAKPLERTKPS